MALAATTTLSSEGQVVIPEEIRAHLGLEAGAEFVVIADHDVVIFKRLDPPSLKVSSALVDRALARDSRRVSPRRSGAGHEVPETCSRARVIVSGDRDLLNVAGWRGIALLTPRALSDQHLRWR